MDGTDHDVVMMPEIDRRERPRTDADLLDDGPRNDHLAGQPPKQVDNADPTKRDQR
jgi:hypothetical protein